MRREDRHRPAQPRHQRCLRLDGVVARYKSLFDHAVEHAIARRAGGVGIAIYPAGFRRLRQRHQQRCFGKRQSLRLFAKIGDRCGANALEIAAIRRQRQIKIENLVFCQLLLDLERAHHLPQLGVNRPLTPRLHQARQLHGDGGAAGDDVPTGDELKRGAAEGERIDPGMRVEPSILISQQQFCVAGIDGRLGIDRQPPAASGHRISAQQFSVAVDDGGGDFFCLRQRQRPERDDPSGKGAGDCKDCKGSGGSDANDAPSSNAVMAGLVPAIHVFATGRKGRGCPGHLARRRRFAPFARA